MTGTTTTGSGARAEWVVIAATGDRLVDVAPYVPAVAEDGLVTFQAALAGGGSGVLRGDGRWIEDVTVQQGIHVISHPDVAGAAGTVFYGTLPDGTDAALLGHGQELSVLAGADDGFPVVGPLGPTANASGAVAFRAGRSADGSGVHTWKAGVVTTLAEIGDLWSGFEGLPVIAEDGTVIVRADRRDGVAGVYAFTDCVRHVVAETGERFETLARFPCVCGNGTVAFAATRRGGEGVVVLVGADGPAVVDETGAYESFRGVLLSGSAVVRIATPRGGELGLFSGPDPDRDRLLAIGDPLLGSTVVDLAANPVSVDAVGHLAVRATLADGRGLILRTHL
jgi:hypothetical protein